MKTLPPISLLQFGIVRPEKIRWLYPANKDVLSSIKSKSTRSFLRKSEQELTEFNIVTSHNTLSEAEYVAWLPYYEAKMTEAGYDIFATKEWYALKISEGKNVEAIFFHTNGQLCGSIIFTTKDSSHADACFKASDQIDGLSKKRQSLGAIIDYFFLVNVTERAFQHVSMGRSRNAFGVVNKVGYLDYKLRFGCIPTVEPGFPLLDEVPVNEVGYSLFFGLKNEALSLYCLTKKGSPQTFDLGRFNSDEMQYIQIEY